MNTTTRKRAAIVACLAALAATAITASTASAAPAAFNLSGTFQLGSTTSLVVKVGTTPTAANTYTCAPASQSWGSTSVISAQAGYGYLSGFDATAACSNGLGAPGTLLLSRGHSYTLRGEKNGGAYSLTAQNGMVASITRPGSSTIVGTATLPTSYSVAWANGTFGGAPSTAAFNDTPITSVLSPVALAGQPITLTGTIRVIPPFGVPLLLN